MSRRAALVGISLLMVLSACAETGAGSGADSDSAGANQAGAPATGPGDQPAAFTARAERLAELWGDGRAAESWRTGFVPLQGLTVLSADVKFNEATKRAYAEGWYRLDTGMPRERGDRTGIVRYAGGGTQDVPVISLAEAYAEIDKGDPPQPCPDFSIPPPADAPKAQDNFDPDRPVSSVDKACTELTIISARLGTTKVLTSRGEADAPAWLFTVRELRGQVAQVAVAPSAVVAPPEIDAGDLPPAPDVRAAQDLAKVDGTRLAYRLGVGACDENIKPLVYETGDVVVVGGTAVRAEGVCTEQLLLHEVTVTLDKPLGARPVIDATTGRVLTLPAVPGR
jgi:hypothetical protein